MWSALPIRGYKIQEGEITKADEDLMILRRTLLMETINREDHMTKGADLVRDNVIKTQIVKFRGNIPVNVQLTAAIQMKNVLHKGDLAMMMGLLVTPIPTMKILLLHGGEEIQTAAQTNQKFFNFKPTILNI